MSPAAFYVSVTQIQQQLKRVTIHVGTNDLRSCKEPKVITKKIIDIAKNSTSNKNEMLISSIVLRRDNLKGNGRQVNNIFEKFNMKIIFALGNHDNIKSRQHCKSVGVYLNKGGSKIVANKFILTLNRQTS